MRRRWVHQRLRDSVSSYCALASRLAKKRDLKPERETGLPQGEQVAILRDPMGVTFGVMVAGE